MTWWSCVNRSDPAQSASVTMPTGGPVDDDRRAVRALGQQRQRVTDRLCGVERERRCRRRGGVLHPGHDVGDDVERDVLRDTAIPPRRATVSAIRRPATGGHVRDDERDGRAGAVGRRQVDVVA